MVVSMFVKTCEICFFHVLRKNDHVPPLIPQASVDSDSWTPKNLRSILTVNRCTETDHVFFTRIPEEKNIFLTFEPNPALVFLTFEPGRNRCFLDL